MLSLRNKKAQGNLETLILIGGAVLVAVIVITILTSLGSNSRKSATDQGDQAVQSTDVPFAPNIVSVDARYADCVDSPNNALLRFSWKPISVDGSFRLIIEDSDNKPVGNLNYVVLHNSELQDMNNLNPNILDNLLVSEINLNGGHCGDSYYLYIEANKNNQTQTSRKYPFTWTKSGAKTMLVYRPTFDPVPGSYNISQFPLSVQLNVPDPTGYIIYYTTDGSTPTTSSNIYNGSGISVSPGDIIEAFSDNGGLLSTVAAGTFNSSYYTVETPIASPGDSINLVNPITVSLSTNTSGADIYYSLNGTDPDCTGSFFLYNTPINVSSNLTIKSIGCKTDYINSSIATNNYSFFVPLDPLTINPVGGDYTSIQHVVITSSNPGAIIHYTLTGIDPTLMSPIYSGPISISSDTLLKAKGFVGTFESPMSTEDYNITLPATAPILTPSSGTYPVDQSILMSSTTPTPYTIRYTTNGTDPTVTSTIYTGLVSINKNGVLKARTFKSGWSDSPITTATYNFALAVPTFNPLPGAYSDSQTVQINSAAGAQIRYTLDGSIPSLTNGTLINAGESTVPITSTSTLKAIAFKSDWSASNVNSGIYIINAPAAIPTFTPNGGTHTNSVSVSLSCTTPGSTIRYSTDGSTPTRSVGTIYSGAFTLTSTTTVNAVCYASGYSTSAVGTQTFTVELIALAPSIIPNGGNFTSTTSALLSTTTPFPYTIRYTTDGSDPIATSSSYTGSAIPISQNTTLKAKTFKSGYTDSPTTTATFNLSYLAPTFNPTAPSNHTDSVTVAINATAGAIIRYTLDGSNPTQTTGTQILAGESTIPITSTSALKAIAYRPNWDSSPIASGVYTINAPAATPTFTPNGGTHTNSVSVSLSCTTPSSTIRYSIDGSTPTRSVGTIYSGAFTLTSTTTVKAVCYANSYSTSAVGTQTFTVNIVPDPVTVSGAGTFCNSATLTASGGAGGVIYYQGTTSNGTSIANQTTTQVVNATGTYYFRSKSVADIWGPSGSAAVTINSVPSAPTLVSGITNVCTGTSTTLTVSGGTGTGYQWYANGCGSGSVLSTSNTLNVSPSVSTTYYVRSTNSCGVSSCISKPVTITPPPVVTVTPGSRCGPGSVNLSATTTSGTIYWFYGATGGIALGTGNNFTTPASSSTETYYVGVVGGTCNLTTRTPVVATINSVPSAVTVSASAIGDCGEGYQLTASGGSGGTIYYQGTTSNGTSTSATTSPIIKASGTYYFRSRSSAGCWGTQGSAYVNYTPSTVVFNQTSFSNLNGWTTNTTGNLSSSGGCLKLSTWWGAEVMFYRPGSSFSSLNDVLIESVVKGADWVSGKPGILFNVNGFSSTNSVLIDNGWDRFKVSVQRNASSLRTFDGTPFSTKANIKIRAIGPVKKVKVWGVGSSEPSNWNVDFSYSSYSSGTFGGFVDGVGGPCSIKVTKCS